MSIEKLDFQTVTKEHLPFTTYLNKVIQNLSYGESLAVWIYLGSLPPDWNVNKVHLENHFGWGEKKIKNIMTYLNKANLIEYRQGKQLNGKWTKSSIHVLSGSKFINPIGIVQNIDKNESKPDQNTAGAISAPPDLSTENTAGSKTAPPVNGCYRKDGHTNTTLLTKEKKEQKPFQNFQNQKQERPLADVTKQSTSASAPPPESPEERQRQWEERMKYYGFAESRTG